MQTKENILTYNEVVSISETYLLAVVSELFGLEGYEIQRIPAHDGGRNVVYTCEKEGADAKFSESPSYLTEAGKIFWPKLNISGIYLSMAAVSRM